MQVLHKQRQQQPPAAEEPKTEEKIESDVKLAGFRELLSEKEDGTPGPC